MQFFVLKIYFLVPLKESPEQVLNQDYYSLKSLSQQLQKISQKQEAEKTFLNNSLKYSQLQQQHIPSKEPILNKQIFPRPVKLPTISQLPIYDRDFNQLRNPTFPDLRERLINAETDQIKNIYQRRQSYMSEPQGSYFIIPEQQSSKLLFKKVIQLNSF